MSDFGKIAPVGSVSPIKMRKVQRREKDGGEGNRDWQEELEKQMKKGSDQGRDDQENQEKEESKPIVVQGHLDTKA